MSKEIHETNLIPLLYQFENLYNKYILLSSIDYKNFRVDDKFDKSLSCAAFELFELLDDDFEKVFCELKKLEHYVKDDK